MLLRVSSSFLCLVGALLAVTIASADQQTITVYGATGRVGARVVSEAQSRGHLVTAVSRGLSRSGPASAMRNLSAVSQKQ